MTKEHTYQWLVDCQKEDERQGETKVEINQEDVRLRLERFAFGQYASVDMAYIDTAAPFKLVPTDTSHGRSEHTISFQIALTGRACGSLPGLGEFTLDPQWGLLTDFSEGNAEFIIDPGEPARTLGGALDVGQIRDLFSGDGYDAELEQITRRRGTLKSFLTTPAMRQTVCSALATPLIGPLRRLYLEGTVLQLFALIFQNELHEPTIGGPVETNALANRKGVELASDLLVKDLSNPPTLLELSRTTGMSARNLSNEFRKVYDESIIGFLTSKRLQAAQDLIQDRPDYPLKCLANDVGYNHVSNFTTAFKRKFGITPAAFAKACKRQGSQ